MMIVMMSYDDDNMAKKLKSNDKKPHVQRTCPRVFFHQDLYQLLQTMICNPKEDQTLQW